MKTIEREISSRLGNLSPASRMGVRLVHLEHLNNYYGDPSIQARLTSLRDLVKLYEKYGKSSDFSSSNSFFNQGKRIGKQILKDLNEQHSNLGRARDEKIALILKRIHDLE